MFGSDALDGQLPYGALIRGNDGALYGNTNVGGSARLTGCFAGNRRNQTREAVRF